MDFLDTNIVVYANDTRDKRKQKRCIEIIERALTTGDATVSTQVLFEYANVALTKLAQSAAVIRRQIELLSTLPVIPQSAALAIRATEIKELYGLSFWDAAIIAAAAEGGCSQILSEDMNTGQIYCGIRLVNPFHP
ncbi:MAG: PIN domain-containing protein [Kiritimatiellae bacterium]|nr:PIN domain-containing protein [Kiritimatiellia bacterium]